MNSFAKIRKKYVYQIKTFYIFNIVCWFNWGFTFQSRIFHLYGDITIIGEGVL